MKVSSGEGTKHMNIYFGQKWRMGTIQVSCGSSVERRRKEEEGRVFVIINYSDVHDTSRNGKKQLQGHQRGGPNRQWVSYPPLVCGGSDDKMLLLLVQKLVLHADEVHDGNGAAAPGHM